MNDFDQLEPSSPLVSNKTFPNFWQATGLLAVYFVLTVGSIFLFIFAEDVFSFSIDESTIDNYMLTVFLFTSIIFLVFITLLGYLLAKSPIKKVFPVQALSYNGFFAILVFTLGFGILLSEFTHILGVLFPDIFSLEDEMFIENTLLSLLLTVIITPIIEELFFRGLLIHGFLPRYGATRAIIFSSILFALVHIDPTVMVYTFIGGIALGWVFVLTGSLIPVIIMHFINNLIAELLSRFEMHLPAISNENVFLPLLIDLVGLFLFVIGVIWLKRLYTIK